MITQHDRFILAWPTLPVVATPTCPERLELLKQVCPSEGKEVSIVLTTSSTSFLAKLSVTGLETPGSNVKVSCNNLFSTPDPDLSLGLLAMQLVLDRHGILIEAKFGIPPKTEDLTSEEGRQSANKLVDSMFTLLKTAVEFGRPS